MVSVHSVAKISNVAPSHARRLLAINFGGIGDEVLFLPTLATIRRLLPSCSITLLLEPRSKSVEQVTDLVDRVMTFDIKKRPLMIGDLVELLAMIKDGGFDIVVSSGGSPLVSLLLFLSGIRTRIGYGASGIAKALLTHPVSLKKEQYAASMYHDLTKGLEAAVGVASGERISDAIELSAEPIYPRVILQSDSISRMTNVLVERGCNPRQKREASDSERLILLHPGTSRLAHEKGIIKTWPADHWIELMDILSQDESMRGLKLILAGGPDDAEIVAGIQRKLEGRKNIISVYGETRSLADLAALLNLCDMMVCVDSAPMHISVALQLPTVALFGPTNPALLIPDRRFLRPIWDKRDGNRSMFDRLGVEIAPQKVAEEVKSLLASQL